ncbi:hypothetical protein EX30DRAFT_165100 [Ascodesmis nigricans]|uniref:Uncharacterized protein n=1 Tax=Ascodesmis nigricans TaxID=341454 RepID=A0A4V3SI03_9PEZI|nr:hypothetical protein EX30DRAFT_165100 [Ascodesmis nigricans]
MTDWTSFGVEVPTILITGAGPVLCFLDTSLGAGVRAGDAIEGVWDGVSDVASAATVSFSFCVDGGGTTGAGVDFLVCCCCCCCAVFVGACSFSLPFFAFSCTGGRVGVDLTSAGFGAAGIDSAAGALSLPLTSIFSFSFSFFAGVEGIVIDFGVGVAFGGAESAGKSESSILVSFKIPDGKSGVSGLDEGADVF